MGIAEYVRRSNLSEGEVRDLRDKASKLETALAATEARMAALERVVEAADAVMPILGFSTLPSVIALKDALESVRHE